MYISTYEAALALVATSMKKARLRIDTLIINSFMGGVFFTTGGAFHVIIQAEMQDIYMTNRGIVSLMIAALYPMGLFYVIIMGTELFNSNILFFSVGVARGAVTIVDLIISWIVSWTFNLIANIFVCYIIAHFSTVFSTPEAVKASLQIVDLKVSFKFHETLIKGIAGNFFVALAVYLQIMAKPLHVKFILMFLPIFTFVGLGYTHVVADMFVLIMGLINGSPHGVGTVAWKVFLPATLGNIIGGSFFGIVIPWYSHIHTVEQDQKLLNLPRYDLRDEQPEINADSRVVQQRPSAATYASEVQQPIEEYLIEKPHTSDTSNSNSLGGDQSPPKPLLSNEDDFDTASRASGYSVNTNNSIKRTLSRFGRSPKNVFPVYGMGEPLEREKSIASGKLDATDMSTRGSFNTNAPYEDAHEATSAEFVGSRLVKLITGNRRTSNVSDVENLSMFTSKSRVRSQSINQLSVSSLRSLRGNEAAYRERMNSARIPPTAMRNSDFVAGSASQSNDTASRLARSDSQISPNNSLDEIEQFRPTK